MHVIYGTATGGTELGVRKLLMGLDSEAFEQTICAIKGGFDWTDMEAGRSVSLNGQRGKSAFLVPRLVRVFRRERPHVVHSRNWGAIEAVPAARLAGCPQPSTANMEETSET